MQNMERVVESCHRSETVVFVRMLSSDIQAVTSCMCGFYALFITTYEKVPPQIGFCRILLT